MGLSKGEDRKRAMKEIEELKKSFESKHLSDVTQKRWLYIAEDFLTYLKKKNIPLQKVNAQIVKDYLATKSRKLTGNSLKTTYYTLKSLFKMWGKKKIFEELEDYVPRGREPERPFFTVDETKQMIKTAKKRYRERDDFFGLRDFVMLLISCDTGSRRIQIQRLNREHFTKEKTLKIPPSFKGGRWTTRTLRKETVEFIVLYLIERKKRLDDDGFGLADKPDSPLLIDKSNKRISPEAMGWAFAQIKKQAGIEKPGGQYHGFRRSKVTRLHKGGMDEITITKVMGWKEGSREPHIYAQLDQAEIQRKAVKADELMDEDEI